MRLYTLPASAGRHANACIRYRTTQHTLSCPRKSGMSACNTRADCSSCQTQYLAACRHTEKGKTSSGASTIKPFALHSTESKTSCTGIACKCVVLLAAHCTLQSANYFHNHTQAQRNYILPFARAPPTSCMGLCQYRNFPCRASACSCLKKSPQPVISSMG